MRQMESYNRYMGTMNRMKGMRLFGLIVTILLVALSADAQSLKDKYTKSQPLKISCDIESYPFEFIGDNGTVEGFNIDVMNAALKDMGVSYSFIGLDKMNAEKNFEANETNLILSPVVEKIPGVFYGKFELATYRVILVQRKGARNINSLRELRPTDVVVARQGGYAAEKALRMGLLKPSQIEYRTLKDAIDGLAENAVDYIISGGKTIDYYLMKYNLNDNVDIKVIDIPAGKMVFASRDKQLIQELDNCCNSMEQSGELHLFTNKWIYGGEDEEQSSPVLLFVLFWALLIICFLMLVNRIVNWRLKHTLSRTIDTNNIVRAALVMGGNNIICSDLKTKKVINLYGNLAKWNGMGMMEYYSFIHPDDMEGVKQSFNNMMKSDKHIETVRYRLNVGTRENPEYRTFFGQMTAEMEKGEIVNVFTTLSDVTEEEMREKEERNTSEIYKHIFEMSIAGLALYTPDGKLISANRTMRAIFDAGKLSKSSIESTSLFDLPAVRGNYCEHDDFYYFVCTRCDLNGSGNNSYIDFRCRPIKSEKGKLLYYMITARDMDDERQMYQQSRRQDEEIRKVNSETQKFERELRILLEESNMIVWRSNVAKQHVTLYKDLRTYEKRFKFEAMAGLLVSDDQSETVRKLIDPALNGGTPCSCVVQFKENLKGAPTPTWFAMNSVPEYDSEGKITGCFGLLRDIDDLINAQLKMKKETERANDSGRLKSVFLANMTHEIRTPLNAIVGFCDVLQSVEAEEERTEFLKIILNNCDLLIQLINDILVISELDSNGLTLRPAKVDFAESFYMICTSLRQRVQEPGVEFIYENPFDHLFVVLDINRIHQVITNFLTNAVKYTHNGHIKLAYERRDGGLYIYCEDTGAGIPKEGQEKIFGRFVKLNDYVQGAGLGLSICKAIAEKCGGRIGVDSEVGKGSTFWIWIPEIKPDE